MHLGQPVSVLSLLRDTEVRGCLLVLLYIAWLQFWFFLVCDLLFVPLSIAHSSSHDWVISPMAISLIELSFIAHSSISILPTVNALVLDALEARLSALSLSQTPACPE